MIVREPRPCINLFVMYRWFSVVPQGLDVLFPLVLFGDFQSLFLVIFLEHFRGLSLWDLVGDVCMNPLWFFSLWFPPPKLAIKGARFWGFRCSRVRGVLGKISSIPLDLASFGGPNLSYGVPMRCSCYPQSLVQIRWAIWEIRSWIWGSWPAGAAHPKSSGHTSLTDADSCWVLLRWTSGWVLCSPVLLLFQVWVSLELGRPVW
jgi:hypothetical protein